MAKVHAAKTARAIVNEALRHFVDNLGRAARLALIPFFAMCAIDAAQNPAIFPIEGLDGAGRLALAFAMVPLPYVVAVPMLAAWQRSALLGTVARPHDLAYRIGAREMRFLGWVALFAGIGLCLRYAAYWLFSKGHVFVTGQGYQSIISGQGVTALLQSFWLVVPQWFVYALLLRFTLVFPATAIGRHLSPAASWRRTHGIGLQLIGAFLIIDALALMVDFLVRVVWPWSFGGAGFGLAVAALGNLIWLAAILLSAGVVACVYRLTSDGT